MIIGMISMALRISVRREQNAPLGRAVIGGLLFATVATLFFVPTVFTLIHDRLGCAFAGVFWSVRPMVNLEQDRRASAAQLRCGTIVAIASSVLARRLGHLQPSVCPLGVAQEHRRRFRPDRCGGQDRPIRRRQKSWCCRQCAGFCRSPNLRAHQRFI